MALYSGKIGCGAVPKRCGIRFIPFLMQKAFLFLFFFFLEPKLRTHTQGMCVHTLSMRTYGLSVRAHTRVCIRTLRASSSLSFPKIGLFLQK